MVTRKQVQTAAMDRFDSLSNLYKGLSEIERKYPGAISACIDAFHDFYDDFDPPQVDRMIFDSLSEEDGVLFWYEVSYADPAKWDPNTNKWEGS